MPASSSDRAILRRLVTYVPFHVVAKACAGEPIGTAAEDREGTVLLADLSGFTALSESFGRRGRDGIDELTSLLNLVFSAVLEDAVFPFDGYLVKFGGDSLLAFFEGPGHLARAAAAASAAQHAMGGFRHVETSRPLALRVGVATGAFQTVTVAAPTGRRDTFCVGDAVLRAMAASAEAGPGETVADVPGSPRGPYRTGRGDELVEALAGGVRPPRQALRTVSEGLDARQEAFAVRELSGFLPKDLFARVSEQPTALAFPAERRHAVAVFADLLGWPEGAGEYGALFAVATDAADRHGGFVNKLDTAPLGPRILATFGTPVARGDDERRAVAFALELRDRLRERRPRIGLESGPLFSGEVGSALKREFTVLGDTVNVAARLAQSALGGQVLCGPDCWSRVDAFLGRPTQPVTLKGKSFPMVPMDVLGPRRQIGRRYERRVGREPLVGREAPLARMDDVMRRALSGKTSAVTLVGPAGIGKSALVGAVVDRWLDHGGVAFGTRCEYDRRDQPYAPARALLAGCLGLPLGQRLSLERCQQALRALGVTDDDLARQVLELLEPAVPHTQPDAASARLSFVRLMRALSAQTPLCVVIEDSHHTDAASSELFQYTLANVPDLKFLAVSVGRPDAALLARARGNRTLLELAPLDRDASRALLARALDVKSVDDRLFEAVESRARGNPFFVLRLARWLAAQGMVDRGGGLGALSFRSEGAGAAALPADLESLVNAELDAFPEHVRQVLRTAAVLGPEFPGEVVAALCEAAGLMRSQTQDALERLAHAGLLMASGGLVPTYRFARLIDREVIYGGLPSQERRRLHATVAKTLAARGANVDRLAVHYDAADDHPNAARCCLEAARQAQAMGAHADALRLYRSAARHLTAVGADPTECQVAEVECLTVLASYGEARALALGLADRLGKRPERVRVLVHAAKCASFEGEHAVAAELIAKAKASIDGEAPAAVRASFHVLCAIYHYSVGQPLEALLEVDDARRYAPDELRPVILGIRSGLLVETGQVASALPAAREAHALAVRQRHRSNVALTLVYLGRALDASGDAQGAQARYLEAQGIYADLKQVVNAANAALHAAEIDLNLGSAQAALPVMLQVLETSRHYAAGQVETVARFGAGRARLLLGEQDEGLADLRAAIELSDKTFEHHTAIVGRAVLAEALWATDRGRATAALEKGLALARERHMLIELEAALRISQRLGYESGKR